MAAIQKLKIRAIRGIRNEIEIEPAGKSLLVQGDNGTGKSSIVQALDWALRGQNAPTGSAAYAGEEGFRVHVLEKPTAARVEIVVTGQDQIVAEATSTLIDPGAAAYRESCKRADPFLRRTQLLQFLGQRPVDRFRYLESFLDLGEADYIRTQLAEQAKALKSKAEALKNNRQRGLNAINVALPVERRPLAITWESLERTFLAWGEELRLLPTEQQSWEDVSKAGGEAKKAASDNSAANRRAQLKIISGDIEAALSGLKALPDLASSSRTLNEEIEKTTDAGLVSLLEKARQHFDRSIDGHCPVCEQDIDRTAVSKSLTERISSLSKVKGLTKKRDTSAQEWHQAHSRLGTTVKNIKEKLGITADVAGPDGVSMLSKAEGTDDFASKVLALGCAKVQTWMQAYASSLKSQVNELEKETPKEDNKPDLLLFSKAVEEATRQRASTDLVTFPELEVEQQAALLSSVSDAIRKARQDVAQSLLDEIAETVTEYYRQIHPEDSEEEVTGAPTIAIQRKSGGIALLRGSFDDKPVEDPRWVYSDGHLDTVGICVFLALRRFRANQSGDAKLMVLDDVVLSIDLGHARRLLMVLKEHFSDHQILLFTHNGLFASWVASLLPSFQRKMITGWTLKGGLKLGDLKSASERLIEDIETSSSAKEIAQSMMTLMDEVLLDARFAYQLSVPAKRGDQYTLSELWEPFCKRLKEVEKALKAPLGNAKAIMEQLSDLARVRNALAAHENEFAKEFPLQTIRDLCKLCLELVARVYCDGCCQFAEPMPDRKRPDLVSCRCRKLMYIHPDIARVVTAVAPEPEQVAP